MATVADKRRTFAELHKSGCFVIPNPWSVGTARYLQGLGFKAIASTSAGYAHSRGLPDGGVGLEDVLAHYRELANATDIPLNADFENCFADDADGVAANVARCIETGVAGLSIEDSPQHGNFPLYEFDLALARVKAARAAIDRSRTGVVLTARTEGFIRGRPDIEETVRRLKAFADAGADCLYSPGIKSREHIEATVKAVGGKAINFLNPVPLGYTVDEIAKEGKFDLFDGVVSNAELNKFFGARRV